jgi:hypothetical protein
MMPGNGRPRAKDLVLEMAATILQTYDEPVHYKMLAQVMVESGIDIPGQRPDQVLYSRIHNDVKRNGSHSAFRFMGNGVFCAHTVEGIELMPTPEIKDNAKPYDHEEATRRRGKFESQSEHELRIMRLDARPNCGNCRFMEFTGVYALSRTRGYCGNYKESHRCGTSIAGEACPGWQRRSEAQVTSDNRERFATIRAIEDVISGKSKRKGK